MKMAKALAFDLFKRFWRSGIGAAHHAKTGVPCHRLIAALFPHVHSVGDCRDAGASRAGMDRDAVRLPRAHRRGVEQRPVGDADHLPFRSAGRSADRRRGCDVSVIGHFIHQHEFRLADANRRRAKRPAMLRPAAACGKHRSTVNGSFDIL